MLGKLAIPLAIGALAFMAGSPGPTKKKIGGTIGGNTTPPVTLPPKNKPNVFGLIGCDPYHTPSGRVSPIAVAGFATHPDYQWCYVVQPGDTAGSITTKFFDEKNGWRYAELLTNNPQKLTKGTTISPSDLGEEELNFASLEAGETLYLPRTWNPYIDQTGTPKPYYDKDVA